MSPEKPLVSFIVPHRAAEPVVRLRSQLAGTIRFPYEVLSIPGTQPSIQRNRAIRAARGRFLYFLDNDSELVPGSLEHVLDVFERFPDAAVVGGPSLTPVGDTPRQQAFGAVLGSFWGTAVIRARYRSIGHGPRETSDRELILCNLCVRKAVLDKTGGFNETLYPNEENELLDRIRAGGGRLFHHPQVAVWRSQRPTWSAFFRQLFGYGRGRAEQLRGDFRVANLAPFVFLGFPAALLVSPLLAALDARLLLPWAVYGLGTLAALLPVLRRGLRIAAAFVPAAFLCHLGYGLGMWRGFFGRPRSAARTPHIGRLSVTSGPPAKRGASAPRGFAPGKPTR
jgi:cellulose synthase/poly-beta-1,6-N-acetylglucosamine synthase-like glycosyltransferase